MEEWQNYWHHVSHEILSTSSIPLKITWQSSTSISTNISPRAVVTTIKIAERKNDITIRGKFNAVADLAQSWQQLSKSSRNSAYCCTCPPNEKELPWCQNRSSEKQLPVFLIHEPNFVLSSLYSFLANRTFENICDYLIGLWLIRK